MRKDDITMSKQTPGSLNLLHVVMGENQDLSVTEQKLQTTSEENEMPIEDSKPLQAR